MKKFAFIPIMALAFVAACDAPQEVQPTEGAAIAGPSFSASGDGQISEASPVCVAYSNKLERLKTELEAKPGDANLTESVGMFETFVSTECK